MVLAATIARPSARHLCRRGEPGAAAGRAGGLTLHARFDLRRHHHECLLDVGGILGRCLQELDPQRVRERLCCASGGNSRNRGIVNVQNIPSLRPQEDPIVLSRRTSAAPLR